MPSLLFWLFTAIMILGGIAVIAFRNPVSSALSVVVSFVGLAGLFISLNAYFVGIIQILVYTGAVMVLFLFIIMLLDLHASKPRSKPYLPIAGGLALAVAFLAQLGSVLHQSPSHEAPCLNSTTLSTAAQAFAPDSKIAIALNQGSLPDTQLIGHTLFTQYNFPFQILGVLLLVATVGVVVLSKKQTP